MRRVPVALLFTFVTMVAAHAAPEPQSASSVLWGVSDSGLEFGKGSLPREIIRFQTRVITSHTVWG